MFQTDFSFFPPPLSSSTLKPAPNVALSTNRDQSRRYSPSHLWKYAWAEVEGWTQHMHGKWPSFSGACALFMSFLTLCARLSAVRTPDCPCRLIWSPCHPTRTQRKRHGLTPRSHTHLSHKAACKLLPALYFSRPNRCKMQLGVRRLLLLPVQISEGRGSSVKRRKPHVGNPVPREVSLDCELLARGFRRPAAGEVVMGRAGREKDGERGTLRQDEQMRWYAYVELLHCHVGSMGKY